MNDITMRDKAKGLLVLPHLRVQNANAISSPLTHGFPSITAFTGLMWALQRELVAACIPLKLQKVGVICHQHEEQVTDGYVKTFRLTRNPVNKEGNVAAIVEEGRIHLDLTLLFEVTESSAQDGDPVLISGNEAQLAQWASRAGEIVARKRIGGGTLLPVRSMPGRRTRPWMEVLSDDDDVRSKSFRRWRRQWLPGYALVGHDDLLAERYPALRQVRPDATLLDAWLHAARFNYQPVPDDTPDSCPQSATSGNVRWVDPDRQKGSGWTVPIPVGYVQLTDLLPAGTVANTRDASTPCVFVESVYSFGEWISPHRLSNVNDLMWTPETNVDTGLYRCRSGYTPSGSTGWADDPLPDFD